MKDVIAGKSKWRRRSRKEDGKRRRSCSNPCLATHAATHAGWGSGSLPPSAGGRPLPPLLLSAIYEGLLLSSRWPPRESGQDRREPNSHDLSRHSPVLNHLVRECAPAVPPALNKFSVGPDLRLGQRVSMLCSVVDGDPPIDLTWYRDGAPLTNHGSSSTGVAVAELGAFESVLRIDHLRPEHNANFTCRASNAAGVAAHSQALTVKGQQSLTFTSSSLPSALTITHQSFTSAWLRRPSTSSSWSGCARCFLLQRPAVERLIVSSEAMLSSTAGRGGRGDGGHLQCKYAFAHACRTTSTTTEAADTGAVGHPFPLQHPTST